MKKAMFILSTLCLMWGCETLHKGQDNSDDFVITDETSTQEIIDKSIALGGSSLQRSKSFLKKKKLWKEAAPYLYKKIISSHNTMTEKELVHSVHLYMSSSYPLTSELFLTLLKGDQPISQTLAWQMAGARPSAAIASAMDQFLSQALIDGEESKYITPEMAHAVRINRLKNAYTLVRQGLMSLGHENFAQAMAYLAPRQASQDFMNYLALSSSEELRQLTQKSVNLYSCIFILNHMKSFPVLVSHPHFDHLFLYAVSRNITLSQLSWDLLEKYLPHHTAHLAFMLAKMPLWLQVNYVENAQRRSSPMMNVFLDQLKQVTAKSEVIETINAIRL